MSHFTVIACLDKSIDLSRDESGTIPGLSLALGIALEPFNENREVEPYREYVEGGPAEYWWVKYVRNERDDYRNGTGILPYNPDQAWVGGGTSGKTEEAQRAQQQSFVKWADQLDRYETEFKGLRWLDVIKLYDAWKRETGDGSEDIFYDEQKNTVYTLNTYNQDSKWDWWTIGGRWAGKFHVKEPFEMEDVLFANKGQWSAPSYDDWDGRIDGGRIKYVDLERKRNEEAERAVKLHRRYHAIYAEHGEGHVTWKTYLARVENEELRIDEARRLYREQPLRIALNADDEFKFWWGDLEEEMSVPEEHYVEIARRGAVTGYSMLTKEGVWMEPGQMGWFGMSSDTSESREAYDVEANKYVESLDPDDIIVVLDLHI